ncbi:FUSC family protein [Amantichitinum ursilacus]|nr:FUSC family protein [Amantichitinum ursilacus]
MPLLPMHLLALNRDPTLPWRQGVSSGISVAVPALIGLAQNEPVGALLGAIGGLYASLLDYGGTARHRLATQSFGLCVIVGSGALGLWLGPHHVMMFLLLGLLTFCIGWIDGLGVAMENIFRFAALALVLYAYIPAPPGAAFLYLVIGICIGVATILIDDRLYPRAAMPRQHNGLRNGFRLVLAGHSAGVWHAVGFCFTSCVALWLAQHLHYARPAWVIAVVLFVTRPDGIDSLTRLFRSVFGALVGVGLAWAVTRLTPHTWALYMWAVLFATLRPMAMVRNFWIHYALMTAMLMVLFDILLLPEGRGAEVSILWIRLHGVLLGSGIALIGMVIFNPQARGYFIDEMRQSPMHRWLARSRIRQD